MSKTNNLSGILICSYKSNYFLQYLFILGYSVFNYFRLFCGTWHNLQQKDFMRLSPLQGKEHILGCKYISRGVFFFLMDCFKLEMKLGQKPDALQMSLDCSSRMPTQNVWRINTNGRCQIGNSCHRLYLHFENALFASRKWRGGGNSSHSEVLIFLSICMLYLCSIAFCLMNVSIVLLMSFYHFCFILLEIAHLLNQFDIATVIKHVMIFQPFRLEVIWREDLFIYQGSIICPVAKTNFK